MRTLLKSFLLVALMSSVSTCFAPADTEPDPVGVRIVYFDEADPVETQTLLRYGMTIRISVAVPALQALVVADSNEQLARMRDMLNERGIAFRSVAPHDPIDLKEGGERATLQLPITNLSSSQVLHVLRTIFRVRDGKANAADNSISFTTTKEHARAIPELVRSLGALRESAKAPSGALEARAD